MIGRVATSLAKQGGWAILIVLLVSCSGPFFSKVQVKATPTIYAPLGNAKGEINDFLTVQKIRDALKDNPDIKVYDFQDASTTQKFLIHFPIASVDLDFGNYLKELDLDKTLSQALAPGTFTVPSLNQTISETGRFDLNGTLRTQVNDAFGDLNLNTTFVETGNPTLITPPANALPDISVTLSTFDSATFSAGSLALDFAMPTASADLVLRATIAIVNGQTVLAQTAAPVNVKSGTATLPLAGVTLPKSFQVRFSPSTSGGQAGVQRAIEVSATLSTDVALSAATGLNLPATEVTIDSLTVPVNGSGKLVSAVIGTGKITVNLDPLWTGFTRTTDITLVQDGVTLATVTDNPNNTIELKLDGKSLNNQPISVSATTSVAASNGTLSNLPSGALELGADAEVDIDLFSTIKVEPGTDFKLVQTFHEPISQQMKDWVDVIRFTEVGIKFTITNSLPSGTFGGKSNAMSINMQSTAFSIPSLVTPINLPAGQTAGQSTEARFTNISNLNFDPSVPTDLDFEVTITPSSYNAGQIDLVNIVPGTALSVSGTVELVADWTTADVSPPSGTGHTGTFPSEGETTDLSVIADYLGTGLSFGQVPAYLSLSGLPGKEMAVQILADYGTTDDETLINEDVTVAATGPTFDPDDDGIITSWDGTGLPTFNLDPILNAKPNNFSLDYSLNLASAVTVTNDTDQPSQKVQADLVIVLPARIIATSATDGTAELKVGDMMPTTDLFGRTEGSDNTDMNKLIDDLVSMTATLAITNTTGLSGQAALVKGPGFSESFFLPTNGGKVTMVFDKADLQFIKNTIPFNPTLTVGIPGSPTGTTYDVRRGGVISASITITTATSIDQTFDLMGNN